MAKTKPVVVMLPDMRGVLFHPYGIGNYKVGMGVYTYSRLAGNPALRTDGGRVQFNPGGTCPGSSPECESICYAKRIGEPLLTVYKANSATAEVPPIPAECRILRIHVSGDFDSVAYVKNWVGRLTERPDVTCWAYTRSWRVAELLPHLEVLRALPNVQLFASMDESVPELPPEGWRRAWIDGDTRAGEPVKMYAHGDVVVSQHNFVTVDGARSYICPEETGRRRDCLQCGYCFEGRKNDVTFLRH